MNDDTRSISDPDAALTDPVLAELFAAMRAEAERPAPPVGPELSRLLTAGLAGQARSRHRRVRGATAGLVVMGVVAGGVGAAAAAGHLSQPFGPATGVGEHRRVQLTPDADEVGSLVVVPPVPTQDPTRLPPTTTDEAPDGTSARRPAPAATRPPDADDSDDSEDEAEDGDSASDGGGRDTGDGGGSQSDEDVSDNEAGDNGSDDDSEHSSSGGSGGSDGSDESDDSGDASDPDGGTSHDGSGGDGSSGADSSGSGGSGSGTDD